MNYSIVSNDSDRRIRLSPIETPDGWTYRVTELDGTELDDEALFPPTATRERCERDIRHTYRDGVWDLQAEEEGV